jgi:hypothetical protein
VLKDDSSGDTNCPACDRPVRLSWSFCRWCGGRLDDVAATVPIEQEARPSATDEDGAQSVLDDSRGFSTDLAAAGEDQSGGSDAAGNGPDGGHLHGLHGGPSDHVHASSDPGVDSAGTRLLRRHRVLIAGLATIVAVAVGVGLVVVLGRSPATPDPPTPSAPGVVAELRARLASAGYPCTRSRDFGAILRQGVTDMTWCWLPDGVTVPIASFSDDTSRDTWLLKGSTVNLSGIPPLAPVYFVEGPAWLMAFGPHVDDAEVIAVSLQAELLAVRAGDPPDIAHLGNPTPSATTAPTPSTMFPEFASARSAAEAVLTAWESGDDQLLLNLGPEVAVRALLAFRWAPRFQVQGTKQAGDRVDFDLGPSQGRPFAILQIFTMQTSSGAYRVERVFVVR